MFKGKYSNGKISETVNDSYSSEWSHEADGICDLDLRTKGKSALTYSSVFRFQYAEDLTYLAILQM